MAADPPTPAKPLLQFDTVLAGTPIEIDGAAYAIRHPESLSLGAYKQIEREFPTLGDLLQRDTLTPEEEHTVAGLLERAVQIVLDAPPDVRARLTVRQRVQAVEAFIDLLSTPRGATGAPRPSTGANSSRASRASTAARPRTGSGARPSH